MCALVLWFNYHFTFYPRRSSYDERAFLLEFCRHMAVGSFNECTQSELPLENDSALVLLPNHVRKCYTTNPRNVSRELGAWVASLVGHSGGDRGICYKHFDPATNVFNVCNNLSLLAAITRWSRNLLESVLRQTKIISDWKKYLLKQIAIKGESLPTFP